MGATVAMDGRIAGRPPTGAVSHTEVTTAIQGTAAIGVMAMLGIGEGGAMGTTAPAATMAIGAEPMAIVAAFMATAHAPLLFQATPWVSSPLAAAADRSASPATPALSACALPHSAATLAASVAAMAEGADPAALSFVTVVC